MIEFSSLRELSFLDPWFLLFGLLVPFLLRLRVRRGAPGVVFAPSMFLGEGLPISLRVRLRHLPMILRTLSLLLAVVALARPIQRSRLPIETEGIDIVLCLDVSSSMLANDMDRDRTRLDVAKDAAKNFISGRSDDRMGLVTFARYPDLKCPLTLDHGALKGLLSDVALVQVEGPEDATGVGTAVARGAQLLRGSSSKSKVLILLTDGEENVANSEALTEIAPLHAAQLCEELGIKVYTIAAGIGRRGPSGSWIKLDVRQVKVLAERTGGVFFEAKDAGAVEGVYASIDELEKASLSEPRFRIEERFLPFLLLSVGLLAASLFLRFTVFEVLP